MSNIVLRPLNSNDCQLLFDWRNDPWIISLSASQKPVDIDEHQAWFADVVARDDVLIRIISDTYGQDMGLVRVVKEHKEFVATITVYLAKPFVGKKRGPEAIKQACTMAFSEWADINQINALIRRGNDRSIAAFEKIGFQIQDELLGNSETLRMSLTRDEGLKILQMNINGREQ